MLNCFILCKPCSRSKFAFIDVYIIIKYSGMRPENHLDQMIVCFIFYLEFIKLLVVDFEMYSCMQVNRFGGADQSLEFKNLQAAEYNRNLKIIGTTELNNIKIKTDAFACTNRKLIK